MSNMIIHQFEHDSTGIISAEIWVKLKSNSTVSILNPWSEPDSIGIEDV